MIPSQTAVDHFIEELIERSSRGGIAKKWLTGVDLILHVFVNFLENRTTAHLLSTTGLHPRYTSEGQAGEAWRHLRLHAGCALLGSTGRLLSRCLAHIDDRQATAGRSESFAEVAANMAGLHCGYLINLFIDKEIGIKKFRCELHRALAVSPDITDTL